MLRSVHSLEEDVVSTRESWGAEAEARVRRRLGVVVPMPTFVPVSYTREFANVPEFHFGR